VAKVIFHHGGQQTVAAAVPGDCILDVARRAGVLLESPCNGNGTCGKCKVKTITTAGRQETVLACRTAADGDITVEIGGRPDGDGLQIKQDGQLTSLVIDSPVRKCYIPAACVTQVYRDGEIIATEPGDTAAEVYGLAVDIGTTTLVVSLVELTTGREAAVTSALNPQSRLAQDVLSRIRYASSAQGLTEMHRLFIAELNKMIGQLAAEADISLNHIYEIVLSGNTCMLHLAANVNPASLGRYPYTPLIRGGDAYPAASLGIHAAAGVEAYLPPVISAYVGADITAGILASRLAELPGTSLFIDIGTNGEMVLATDGVLAATSTAAGPAFEGMNISHGMRAAAGAVEAFRLDDAGERVINTIGGKQAVGICGSGLVDIVAELVRTGLVGRNGRFSPTSGGQARAYLIEFGDKPAFAVADEVLLTQQDVRQVQLAKGAIRAGIEALLAHRGLTAEKVDRVLIAGSFGYHLNPASLIAIGLLPVEFAGRIEFLGNTSKTGAQAFLLNGRTRREINRDIAGVTVLELATIPNFDRLFVKCLDF
jgi:uncharacterized 2Fe-2S/4Fe-4S cluster protein (DUF4445 family)